MSQETLSSVGHQSRCTDSAGSRGDMEQPVKMRINIGYVHCDNYSRILK